VLGIGLNYAAHAAEQGAKTPERPVVFSKAAFAVVPSGTPIRVPKLCQDQAQVDWEGELVIVIGSGPGGALCRDVPKERALDFVLGYAAGNDVSARWWQKQGSGGQFNRGKSFDTFAPMSDVTPASAVPNPGNLRLTTKVNSAVMQDSSTSDLIFDVATLVSDLSRGWTLVPGTAIFTGTPSGVGMARNPQVYLKHGDGVEVTIESVGTVTNRVEFE
jgi:2-keto-4-pentenoate hydratase/2-oxohepta-3-ene-1,7-dioic acid hydratase in catechol pathway